MPEDRPRTPRTLLIPDHLWDALASMAAEMGADREALVNQALFTFARLNGYLIPSDSRRLAEAGPVQAPVREVSPANGRDSVEVEGTLLREEEALPTSMELRDRSDVEFPRRPEPPDPTPSPLPGRVPGRGPARSPPCAAARQPA